MGKKNFAGSFNTMLSNMGNNTPAETTTTKEAQAPAVLPADPATRTQHPAAEKKRGRGRPRREDAEQMQRATLVLPVALLEEMKAITCAETGRRGKTVHFQDMIATALENYIKKYNSENK